MDLRERIYARSYPALDRAEVTERMFFPAPLAAAAPAGAEDIVLDGDGCGIGCRFHRPGGNDGPNLVLFHGARDTVADCDPVAAGFARAGVAVLAAGYRGYGNSNGKPGATAMIRDAHAVFEAAVELFAREGRKGPVTVMGRSLGAACAIEIAAFHPQKAAGLIIESGFARTLTLLAALGIDHEALGIREEDGFANPEKIRAVTRPTLILHGAGDQVIPFDEAATLHAECAARSKELSMVPGAGHRDIPDKTGAMYFEVLCRFLQKTGKETKRKPRPGIRGG
jgi:alpha-beta hydrolase superfamily lysophospholipase